MDLRLLDLDIALSNKLSMTSEYDLALKYFNRTIKTEKEEFKPFSTIFSLVKNTFEISQSKTYHSTSFDTLTHLASLYDTYVQYGDPEYFIIHS